MDLKWSLFTKDIRPHPQLRVKLQQKIHKLAEHLEHLPPDAVDLKVSLEKHEKKKWFRAALALKTPSGIVRVQKFGDDPISIADQAVKAMVRELSRPKASLRGEKERGVESSVDVQSRVRGTGKSLAPSAPPLM